MLPAAPINHSLQILRGLSALSVLLTHFLITLAGRGLPSDPGRDVFAAGVDVFFVISGYIMASLVEDAGRGQIAATRFLLRRGNRLLPVYLLLLSAQVILGLFVGGGLALDSAGNTITLGKFAAAAALIPACPAAVSHPSDCMPLLTVAWSLVFEWLFYIVTALAILLGANRLWYAVLLLYTYAGILLIHAATGGTSKLTLFFMYPSATQPMFFLFLAGVGVRAAIPWLIPRAGIMAPAALAAAAGLALWAHRIGTLDHASVLWSALAVSAVAGFVLLDRVSDCRRHAWSAALVKLGDWSYSLYLVHGSVLGLVIGWWLPTTLNSSPKVPTIVLLTSAITVSVAVSAALHRWVERPCNRFLNRLSDRMLGSVG